MIRDLRCPWPLLSLSTLGDCRCLAPSPPTPVLVATIRSRVAAGAFPSSRPPGRERMPRPTFRSVARFCTDEAISVTATLLARRRSGQCGENSTYTCEGVLRCRRPAGHVRSGGSRWHPRFSERYCDPRAPARGNLSCDAYRARWLRRAHRSREDRSLATRLLIPGAEFGVISF